MTTIQQFLDNNIAILTASFEVGEADYDENVLPVNAVASACRKIDKALQDKKKELLGQIHVQEAVRQFNDMIDYLQHGETNSLEEQKISLESFPKKWNRKRKRVREDNEDSTNEDGDNVNSNDEGDDEYYSTNKKLYAQNLRQAITLEKEIAEARQKLALYKDLTKLTTKIDTKEIVDKSILAPKSSLTKELEKSEEIAARINKKLAKNPQVLEKLKKKQKSTKEETANQAATSLLSKITKSAT